LATVAEQVDRETGEAIAAHVAAITARGGTVVSVRLVPSADGGAAVAARIDHTAGTAAARDPRR